MTEEEKATEYANEQHTHVILQWEKIKQAYLDGLHEGQPKWHKQSDSDDIYDACNDWSVHYFVCRMKDGTINFAFGNCDEDCNGGVSTTICFEFNDENYYVDDIYVWQEIEIPQVKE